MILLAPRPNPWSPPVDRHDLHVLLRVGCEQCDRRVEALLTPPPSSPRRSEGRTG